MRRSRGSQIPPQIRWLKTQQGHKSRPEPRRFLFGFAVFLLDHALKLLAIAIDLIHLIIGQLALFGLNMTLHFFPFTFDLVPVHLSLL